VLARENLVGVNAWTMGHESALKALESTFQGLSENEAERRQTVFGLNELEPKKKRNAFLLFAGYFINPLVLLLLTVAGVSYFLDNKVSAVIVAVMAVMSVSITFYQEYTARDAAERLRKLIRNTASVVRDGSVRETPLKFLVPGDVVRLSAGDMVPADCRIIVSKDFFVNQASLTGESLPVEKNNLPCKESAILQELSNAAFFGSSVVSGSGDALVVSTGPQTQFGEVTRRLSRSGPETAFDRGIREYSNLMVKLTVLLVVGIFFINFLTKNDVVASVLFSLAVAVGLAPEMLPVIVTANLSQGARNMVKKEVIVKRLSSIQNLGAMDVLCTDKTGTLTEGTIKLVRHVNIDSSEDERVLRMAYLNAFYQTGLKNPMDTAIMVYDEQLGKKELEGTSKIDEVPFDFVRRRMSVVIHKTNEHLMLTKGSPESVLCQCTRYHKNGNTEKLTGAEAQKANDLYESLSSDGFRVLALASRRTPAAIRRYHVADEDNLTFEGFLAFLDPPKPTAHKSLQELVKRGIEVKILSGDNELVNRKIAKEVGLDVKGVITGSEIDKATDESLSVLVETNTIFARMSPVEKDRIIRALQRNKHVVGYLGDGINDALSLKTSDVGISVDSAVDVAKESADVLLLRSSLHVLYEGVDEGRRTFANTSKYLRMGSSSNFGNMFSVVGASFLLPFLPMAPIQIIANNFLYDISQLGVTTDKVDTEALSKPAQWKMDNLKNFIVFMGPVSSIFDYLTFGVLWFVFGLTTPAQAPIFHAGWFIESLMTQTLVVHVIRTNKIPFLESSPSKGLVALTAGIVLVGFAMVCTPIGEILGFAALPFGYFVFLFGIVGAYLVLTQLVKTALLKIKFIE